MAPGCQATARALVLAEWTKRVQAHTHFGLLAALRLDLPAEELEAVLTESDATAFDVADGLSWRGHEVPLDGVPFSIGSCSLREPDADLKRLFG